MALFELNSDKIITITSNKKKRKEYSLNNLLEIERISHNNNENKSNENNENSFSFVIGADTQLGIGSNCLNWDYELSYSIKAVNYINTIQPKPSFVCICGDLIDMEPSIFKDRYTIEDCLRIQTEQFNDFKRVWNELDNDIPLLCLCGNHDVGNTPTAQSIQRFTTEFGNDYFAFLFKTTYCICLNTNLYNDNSLAFDLYEKQHNWLEEQLIYAKNINVDQIFLFGHHPWFLKHENETDEELTGVNYIPNRPTEFIPDSYFHIKLEWRRNVMELCHKYNVTACFAGHYHQNLITYSSWGMPMIVTGGICNWNTQSTDKDATITENTITGAGVRVVIVDKQYEHGFTHNYQLI